MFIADCEWWVSHCYPNLPIEHHTELVLSLGEFHPTTMETMTYIQLCYATWPQFKFSFPFVDIPEDFPHTAYEEFQEKVYQNMMEKYNLTPYHFEC